MSFFETGFQELRRIPIIELAPLIGIPLYWIIGIGIFAIYCAITGMPRTERIEKSRSKIVPRFVLEYGYWQLRIPVFFLLKLRFTPNLVTLLSLALAGASGVLFGVGRFSAGGWMLAFSAACDALDGIVARETGTSSDRGEYFDSFIDRYADFFVMFGLLYYYRNDPLPAALVALAIIGSQVMGYAKAKGEAVGIDPKVGFMQRHERCVYLLSAAVLSPVASAFFEPGIVHPRYYLTIGAVALIAVLTNITSVWRALYVMKRMAPPPAPTRDLRREPPAPDPRTAGPGDDRGDGRTGRREELDPLAAPALALRTSGRSGA